MRPTVNGRRRLGTTTIAVVAFIAGTLTAGVGAVWAEHQFSDVPTNHPFHNDIDWLTKNGIAQGYPGEVFKPADPVSRQAFAAFLHRYNDEIEVVNTSAPGASLPAAFISAPCPVGKRAISGGGFNLATPGMILSYSRPSTSGTAWEMGWISKTGANVSTLGYGATAFCIPE